MSFILKQNPTVLNIKLTNEGRKAMAEGRFTFVKWAVGDSEIDYAFNNSFAPPIDAFNANILRPKDGNPNIISFLKRNDIDPTGNTIYTTMTSVPSITSIVENPANERGFFLSTSGSPYTFNNAPTIVKQPDAQVDISTVSGGKQMTINKSPNYIANVTEPVVGDYLLIKWANPDYAAGTVNFDVETVPTLWYKIEDIVSGTLSGDNLVVEVDRELPDFNGQGSGIYSSVFIYPNSNNRGVSGDSIQNFYGKPYITDFVSDAVLSFLQNWDCNTIDVPVWNMSIVFRDQIAGVKVTDRTLQQYWTSGYVGFVQYIEQLDDAVKKIGIIHYTNNSPSNQYGELLVDDTPVLELPTIMWHKRTDGQMGITLTADTASRNYLPDLNTVYYNLVDGFGNTVGKVFNDLKIFVIEDQELLFAMSYKSNRNWTIPAPIAGFNFTLCTTCDLDATFDNSVSGQITISATGAAGSLSYILNGPNNTYTASIIQSNNVFTGLAVGNYSVTVVDSGAPDCTITLDPIVVT